VREASPLLSVVIPAYNEEGRIATTLAAVRAYLQHALPEAEVIVVDDGSEDATAQVVEKISSEPGVPVRLIRNRDNHGKGYSVRQGALAAQGDLVLFTDADLSTPIEDLERLRRALEEERADVAIGSRNLPQARAGVQRPWYRELMSRAFNLAVRLILVPGFSDTQCGFKLFTREAARELFSRQLLDRWSFDAELLFLARKRGLRVVEVPVRWEYSSATRMKFLRNAVQMLCDLFRVRWNDLRRRYD